MKLVVKRADGGVSITHLKGGENVERLVATQSSVFRPEEAYVSHRIMPDEALPTDRAFRNAWCDETPDEIIDIDMPKAREIHRERLRMARKSLLADLDISLSRAKTKAERDQIEAERQALRDITDDPAIEAAQTPDELLAAWPK